MEQLFEIADKYLDQSDWKTIAVLKFCLLSLGLLVGMTIPKEQRKAVALICVLVFLASYIPLMKKLYDIAKPYFMGESEKYEQKRYIEL